MKRLAILLLILTCGCACNNEDIPSIQVMKPTDKYLNCNNLKRELVVAKFQIRASERRLGALPAYAKNITCMPATQLQIEKTQNLAENRVDYLETLMREKGCELPTEQPEVIETREPISIIPLQKLELEPGPDPIILQKSLPPRTQAIHKHRDRSTFVLKKKKHKKPCK